MPFHLRLVGPPELRSDTDRPVALRTRKQLALLVVLALEAQRRPISRERLVDLLWPDSDRARARHSLSQALTSVRGVLGPDAIERRGAGIRLATRVRTDLDDPVAVPIEHLGPGLMLEGFDHLAGAEYSHWVDGARARIRRGLRAALSSQIRECRVQGQAARVQERAERLYHLDPGDAYATHLLAEHVAEMGDRGRAIDLLTEFLDRRRDAPADDRLTGIRRLLARLQAGADVPPEEESYARCERRLPFVGREREMRRLQAAWDAVGGDGGLTRTCLVAGRAGVGKSTLLRRFTGIIAADGRLVLRTTGDRAGRDVPFATVCGFLRQLSTDPDFAATDPHWLAEASRIAPFLRDRFPGIPAPPPATGETVRFSVAEAFYQILDTVAAGSAALLVVDDLHYLDAASRDVLYVLTRRQRAFGLMVVGTVRTHDIPVNGEEAPGEPGRIDWAERIDLGPLSPADTHTVLGGLLELRGLEADPEVRKTIVHLAAGIPYFVEVLVNDWTDQGVDSLAAMTLTSGDPAERWNPPPSIRHAFERRERAMSSAARDIYRLIAVAGTAIEPETIASITSHDVRTITQVLSDAIATGELASRGASVAFTNEVHRAYVYRETPEPIRRFLHGRLGIELSRGETRRPTTAVIEASHHLLRAGMINAAVTAAQAGARLALSQGAAQDAERIGSRILNVRPPDASALLLTVAEALSLQGRYRQATSLLNTSGSHLQSQHQLELCRFSAEQAVRDPVHASPTTDDLLTRYSTYAMDARDDMHQHLALMLRAEHAAATRDRTAIEAIINHCNNRIRDIGDDRARGPIEVVRGFCYLIRGSFNKSYRSFTQAYHLLAISNVYRDRVRSSYGAGVAAAAMGAIAVSKRYLDTAIGCARRLGDHRMIANVANTLATTLVDYGELQEAKRLFDLALEENHVLTPHRNTCILYNNLADWHVVTGELEQAIGWAARSTEHAEALGFAPLVAQTHLAHADIHLAGGDHERALDMIAAAEEILSTSGDGNHLVYAFDTPHLERLVRIRQYFLGNPEPAARSPFLDTEAPMQIATLVELAALREWTFEQTGERQRVTLKANQMVAATGLIGVAMRLRRLGVAPKGLIHQH